VSERHELRPVDVEAEACIFAAYERGRAAGWRERGEADAPMREALEWMARFSDVDLANARTLHYDMAGRARSVLSATACNALPPAPPQEDRT
jgi:hypothetical protein